MTEDNTLVFKSISTVSRKFSKVPAIRKFESLISDEQFESAGFKIARHPLNETRFIVPANEYIFDDSDSNSNKLVRADDTFLHVFNFAAANDLSPVGSSAQELNPTIERIDELRAIAAEDNLPFSEKSASEALKWLRTATPPSPPNVFLLNNGNIRFLWKRHAVQLGIQFLGDGSVQFVFLGEDDQTERIFGSLKASELTKRINGLDLQGILGF